nr:MAG TPA: nucleic-acid-binding protein [Caudoviricetes sp.]
MSGVDSNAFGRYLEKKTGSNKCPFCHKSNWQIQVESRILGDSFIEELQEALVSGGVKNERDPSDSVFENILAMKCGHCGYLALFDIRDVLEGIKTDE